MKEKPKKPHNFTDIEMEAFGELERFESNVPQPALKMRVCPYFIVCSNDMCQFYKPALTYSKMIHCTRKEGTGTGEELAYNMKAATIKPAWVPYIVAAGDPNVIELIEVNNEEEVTKDS